MRYMKLNNTAHQLTKLFFYIEFQNFVVFAYARVPKIAFVLQNHHLEGVKGVCVDFFIAAVSPY